MKTTESPRTDAVSFRAYTTPDNSSRECVSATFARGLERENQTLREWSEAALKSGLYSASEDVSTPDKWLSAQLRAYTRLEIPPLTMLGNMTDKSHASRHKTNREFYEQLERMGADVNESTKPHAAAVRAADKLYDNGWLQHYRENYGTIRSQIHAEYAPLVEAVERLLAETGKYDLNFITSDNGECDRAEQKLRAELARVKGGA